MSWIKIFFTNVIIFVLLVFFLEIFSGLVRVLSGRDFLHIGIQEIKACEEMRTDVLLSHVPSNKSSCIIDNGYVDGEYVKYNISSQNNPVIVTIGGSTTTGLYEEIYGKAYPRYLAEYTSDRYQILNGGVGGYSSLQELFKIIRDAPRIKNLHTVIALNGINETPDYQGQDKKRSVDFPFLTSLQNEMNNKQIWIDQRPGIRAQGFLPNTFSLFQYIFGKSKEIEVNTVPTINNPIPFGASDRWYLNVTRSHAILKQQGVRYLVFLQPTLGLNGPQATPPLGSADEKVLGSFSQSYYNEIENLYSKLRVHCARLSYCFDISNEVAPTGNLYHDPRHHNAKGNKLLAKVIADTLLLLDLKR